MAIARSAAFVQCRCGDTSWKWILRLEKKSFNLLGHSLSSICVCGLKPRFVRKSWRNAYTRTMSSCERDFIGVTRMAFVSLSNNTMMYLIPLLDAIGNRSFWSEKKFPSISTIFIVTIIAQTCS